jgi:hypothetical protein
VDADGAFGTPPGLMAFNGSAWQSLGSGSLLANLFGEEVLTNHLARLAGQDGAGQCLRGVFVRQPSTKRVRLYRDGRHIALDVCRDLLALDDLDAFVTAERHLVVERRTAPPSVLTLRLDANGGLRLPDGSPWGLSMPPVGRWACLQLSAGLSVPVRLERVKWRDGNLRVEGFSVWTGKS